MKPILFIFLFFASAASAQVPHIDYMIADEAKSQLQIHGTFGPDNTGGALIEGVPCSVRYWSDTMVICDLPDSGAGSGGHVTVQQMTGTSNARMLSIFKMGIERDLYPGGFLYATCEWYGVNWRLDIAQPNNIAEQNFENSKVSWGSYYDPKYSSKYQLPTGSLVGMVKNSELSFSEISMSTLPGQYTYYQVRNIPFDSTGRIMGYSDVENYRTINEARDIINIEILFPPSTQSNSANFSLPPLSIADLITIFTNIGSEDHLISLVAEEPLGETTASLYSIDGRIVKQEKINISSAGIYYFDANGVNTRVGFLVLKTEEGTMARKVMF